MWTFQSTLPARGSDLLDGVPYDRLTAISIHAPRKGERPCAMNCWGATYNIFQSTLPARGSDERRRRTMKLINISIHAPRKGERPCITDVSVNSNRFQSTLPARGSDPSPPPAYRNQTLFQSTLPARGSDKKGRKEEMRKCISIHAPRKGERHLQAESD